MIEREAEEVLAVLLAKKDAAGHLYVGAGTRRRAAAMIRALRDRGYELHRVEPKDRR